MSQWNSGEFWRRKIFGPGRPDPNPNATCLCEVLRPDGVTEVEVELTPAEPVDVTVRRSASTRRRPPTLSSFPAYRCEGQD